MERLIDYFVPDKYVLALLIDKKQKSISGVVNVTGEAKSEVVKFHAVKLEVVNVSVNGEKKEFKADGEILTIYNIPSGKVELQIEYRGALNENMQGAYLSTYEYNGKTETIVATQFESHYAREAFPCIDEPEAKAVFELSLTVPKEDGEVVISNVPVVKETEKDYNTKYEFKPTPRMSTYLLAFVIGKFHGKTITNKHDVKITTYCALNQDVDSVDFANEIAAKSLEFYDDNFGVPYPLEKLDQVALPDFEAGAMENWGLVTYRESMLLSGKNSAVGTKKSVALTVAHELSHQWFGDLVTMKWWDELWLNESFASIMEYYAVDNIHPEYKIFEGFFAGDALAALKRDCLTGVQSVHQDVKNPAEIATLFDPAIVYAKGARLMLMVIRAMGWKNFTDGIKEYFEKFKYENTVGDDLWEALGRHADFDVKGMMHAFIDRPGYPVITNIEGNFKKYTQKRFLIDGELEDSQWVLPQIYEDMSGHYILNLSEPEFDARLERFNQLGLEEKLRLLIDRNLVTKTRLCNSASLIPLVAKFKNEDSAIVWDMIAMTIGNLKLFFQADTEEEKAFKKFVGELAEDKLKEIGLVTRNFDDVDEIRLRSNLLALKFYAEDETMLRELAGMYREDYSAMDMEVRDDILDAKMYLESGMIDKYIEDYQKIADPEIKYDLLFAMSLSKDEKVIDKMISLLSDTKVVKPQDQFYLFIYLYRNSKARKKAFDWLRSHWDYVKEISGDKSLDNYPRYMTASIKSEEEKRAYLDFFLPKKDDPALSRAIAIGENEIEAQLKLISEDGEELRRAIVG